jgi:crossover junction endodeoxyribonuclease RuvC
VGRSVKRRTRRQVREVEPTYVGIDASLTCTGFVAITGDLVTTEQIKPPSDLGECERIQWMRDEILSRVLQLQPRAVGIEGFAFAQANRAHQLGGLGYVLRIAMIERGVKLYSVPIGVNKKFVTGKGNSPKAVMILNVFKKWGFETASDDIADGYGVTRCIEAYFSDSETQRVQDVKRKVERVR